MDKRRAKQLELDYFIERDQITHDPTLAWGSKIRRLQQAHVCMVQEMRKLERQRETV